MKTAIVAVPEPTKNSHALHNSWHSLLDVAETEAKEKQGISELSRGVWQIELATALPSLGLIVYRADQAGLHCKVFFLGDDSQVFEFPNKKP